MSRVVRRSRSLGRLIIYGGIILIPLSLLTLPIIEGLIIESDEAPPFRCFLPSQHFTLRWIHSVEHTPWEESYRVEGGKLRLYQSQFKNYGAGTPEQGQLIKSGDQILFSTNLLYPKIYWASSQNVASTIISGGREWPIYRMRADYSGITLSPSKRSLLQRLLMENCYDYFEPK